jgi:non-ribosomal peptide synthetase component F
MEVLTMKTVAISVDLPTDDLARLTWWAEKKGVPVAVVLRDAVWAYLLPVRDDYATSKSKAAAPAPHLQSAEPA